MCWARASGTLFRCFAIIESRCQEYHYYCVVDCQQWLKPFLKQASYRSGKPLRHPKASAMLAVFEIPARTIYQALLAKPVLDTSISLRAVKGDSICHETGIHTAASVAVAFRVRAR
jgi:hypothetical protein